MASVLRLPDEFQRHTNHQNQRSNAE